MGATILPTRVRPAGGRLRVAAGLLALSAIAGAILAAFPRPGRAADTPSSEAVRTAIARAAGHLERLQTPDGTWPDYAFAGGETAMAAYALLQAGVRPGDPALERALAALVQVENERTYVVALKALAFAAADPTRYRAPLQAAVDWLLEAQHATGAWGYADPDDALREAGGGLRHVRSAAELRQLFGRTDLSNTQFAVLALAEAETAGAHIPAEAWTKIDRHLRTTQLAGGGWGYVFESRSEGEPYGSVTAAALASLYLVHQRLAAEEPSATTADRAAALERGLGWIAEHYTLAENPGRGPSWYYFWLYALERAGIASGRRTFGAHDWYREGAARLLQAQRGDGSWTGRIHQDAAALLFLAKAFKPLLVQRLVWPAWREDPRDLARLTAYLDTRVGGRELGWQTVDADAPLETLLAAPILHVAGTGPVRLLDATLERLRAYVQQGGLILFDPTGGDEAFVASARRLAGELFEGAAFEPLPPNHPLYRAAHRVPPRGLEALDLGCRASVLLAPDGLGDAWAAAEAGETNDALRLGENLAQYATGGEPLPDRLHHATVLALPEPGPVPRGALRIGQIQHGGDWRPRPFALPGLLKEMASTFGLSVVARPMPVRLAMPGAEGEDAAAAGALERLGTFPVLYLVGHYAPDFSPAERAALKAYLDRGGFLWAEACCGREAFGRSFRDLVAAMYPDAKLKRLPADHPIFQSPVGYRIDEIAYTQAVRAEQPDLHEPVLWGLERGGHLVIVYSPFGIGPGLDRIQTWGARCVAPADARRLAVNLLLYALTE